MSQPVKGRGGDGLTDLRQAMGALRLMTGASDPPWPEPIPPPIPASTLDPPGAAATAETEAETEFGGGSRVRPTESMASSTISGG